MMPLNAILPNSSRRVDASGAPIDGCPDRVSRLKMPIARVWGSRLLASAHRSPARRAHDLGRPAARETIADVLILPARLCRPPRAAPLQISPRLWSATDASALTGSCLASSRPLGPPHRPEAARATQSRRRENARNRSCAAPVDRGGGSDTKTLVFLRISSIVTKLSSASRILS